MLAASFPIIILMDGNTLLVLFKTGLQLRSLQQ